MGRESLGVGTHHYDDWDHEWKAVTPVWCWSLARMKPSLLYRLAGLLTYGTRDGTYDQWEEQAFTSSTAFNLLLNSQ